MNNQAFYRQRGLSIVELMVALAISSFLILGITQVYIDNKRNYIFQQSQAGNLSNSRFVSLLLDELLSKAGYRRVPDQDMSDAFPASTALSNHCAAFPAEAAITKLKSTAEVGFCMRYQPAMAGEMICDGSTTTLASETPFRYPEQSENIHVAIKFVSHASDLNKGVISCVSDKGTAAVELLSGIADMQVEFGSGLADEKRLKSSSPYKKAAAWSDSDGIVRAVRYSVLSASRSGQRDSESLVFTRWLANTATKDAADRLNAQDDRQIYQAAAGAQAIRNMMP